jgi:lysophospholipase L1-like esterase
MNIIKRIFLLFITFIFAISVTVTSAKTEAPSNYTSLGDSIAYGMSATPNNGFVELFYNNLKTGNVEAEFTLNNFGTPGDTSSDLLNKLQTNLDIQNSLKSASVITVSIGGNNVLKPIIAAMCEAFQLDPTSPTLTKEISEKVNASPDGQAQVQTILSSKKLETSLVAGTIRFTNDWIKIISEIKRISPNARLYIITLYNPEPSNTTFDQAIQTMNRSILAGAASGGYFIADVYTVFKNYKGLEPLVDFSITGSNADPHPTNKGHEIIFQELNTLNKLYLDKLKNPTIKEEKPPITQDKPSRGVEEQGKVTLTKSKDASISSTKYIVDKNKSTISIKSAKHTIQTFKVNIKLAKGATMKIIKADGSTVNTGNILPGMKVKVMAEGGKTIKVYTIIK